MRRELDRIEVRRISISEQIEMDLRQENAKLKDINSALLNALKCAHREMGKTAYSDHSFALLRYCKYAILQAEKFNQPKN